MGETILGNMYYVASQLQSAEKLDVRPEEARQIVEDMDRFLMSNRRIPRVVDVSEYEGVDPTHIALWCNRRGFYSLPTTELANVVQGLIDGRTVHEIGSGHSSLAKHLGIYHSDPRYQRKAGVMQSMLEMLQAAPAYVPREVANKTCAQVVATYKPQVLLAQWVTPLASDTPEGLSGNYYGPDYKAALEVCETLIFVGNTTVHPSMKVDLGTPDVELFNPPWLISRSKNPNHNVLWVWNRK